MPEGGRYYERDKYGSRPTVEDPRRYDEKRDKYGSRPTVEDPRRYDEKRDKYGPRSTVEDPRRYDEKRDKYGSRPTVEDPRRYDEKRDKYGSRPTVEDPRRYDEKRDKYGSRPTVEDPRRYDEKRDKYGSRPTVEDPRHYGEGERDSPSDLRGHPRQAHWETYSETSVPPSEMEQYEPEPRQVLYNLRYLCTARALCQVMEFLLNMLLVICAGVSYNTSGGYKDLASLGGLYAYYFGGANAFTGADAQRVKELDILFYQRKVPPYIFTMACGGALMGYASFLLLLGVLTVPFRWPVVLLLEALIDGLIALGYIPAMAFYFIKLQETYDSDICKEREAMYKSKGHQGFECKLHGADIAGGLFGVLGVIAFSFGAVFAIRAFRAVRERKRSQDNQNF